MIKISKINYNINFDLNKKNDENIVNYIREYSDEYYIKQSAVLKMILKIAILDMNILNFNFDSLPSSSSKNNTSISANLASVSPKEEIITSTQQTESNSNLSNLISNSINSLI